MIGGGGGGTTAAMSQHDAGDTVALLLGPGCWGGVGGRGGGFAETESNVAQVGQLDALCEANFTVWY